MSDLLLQGKCGREEAVSCHSRFKHCLNFAFATVTPVSGGDDNNNNNNNQRKQRRRSFEPDRLRCSFFATACDITPK